MSTNAEIKSNEADNQNPEEPRFEDEDVNHDSVDNDEDDDDDEWDEVDGEQDPAPCLFCGQTIKSIELAIEHLDAQHDINLGALKLQFDLDQYSYIKMINYIRTHSMKPIQMKNANPSLWNDDIYLKPVSVDAWLTYDIEDLDSRIDSSSTANNIQSLQAEIKEKDAIIEQLRFQISQMQKHFQDWVERDDKKATVTESNGDPDESSITHVAEIPMDEDQSYFASYAHFHIHHEMLSDAVRTESYRDAILTNRPLFEQKVVMDLGCGTSILSMFSSQAGAKQVIAVDQSDIIYQAMEITLNNDVPNIHFVKGRLENVDLPLNESERIDIIISEWMGYFLLYEGMLDSVIYARDKYLKPDGLVLPNRCTISLVGLCDEERHNEHVRFWNDVYGFDMSTLQSDALKEASVEICPPDTVCTHPVVMSELDIKTVGYDYINFVYDFELEVTRSGKLTAFAGYFDTFFDLPNAVHFSTGPQATSTHWKQVVFYIKDAVCVAKGDKVRGQFQCKRGNGDARAIRIKITVFEQEFFYSLN